MTQQNFRQDSFVEGLAVKAPVRTIALAPVTLQGEQTINLVPLVAGDRILVAAQADPIENGIYTVESSNWQRAGDWDGERDVVGGTRVPVYDAANTAFVEYIVGGNGTPLSPDVDAMNFTLYYDPNAGGGAVLPISTSLNNTLRADNAGGWVEEDTVRITSGGLIAADGGLNLGDSDVISFTYSGNILTTIGTGGFVRWDVNVRQHFIQPFYMLERAAAGFDQVGLGQFWVRNDSPNTPMFTDDTGVDYELNAAPTFAPPLVLLDDEQIQFGTAAPDVTMEFDSGINGILIDPIAINTPFALNNAMGFRLHNQNGSGYIQFRNDGLLALNDLTITASGGTSNISIPFGIAINIEDNRFLRPVLDDYAIQDVVEGSVAGAVTFDFENGNSQYIELTENITSVTLDNPPASGRLGQIEIEILQDSTPRTVTWPGTVNWNGGTPPDLSTANGTYLVHLRTRTGGAAYLGTWAGPF